MPSKQFLTEISENVTLYHRSKYPMKVGDIIKPKKDEDGKHWLEHVPAEVAMEIVRRRDYPDKPSRFNCVYSSVIPRSRFVDKGTLYVVKPRGKMLVTNSAWIDEIHEDFDRMADNHPEFRGYENLRKAVRENPERLEYILPHYRVQQYWEGRGPKRKEDIEILSSEAVIIEIIDETGKRLSEDKVYVVKDDNKLPFTFRAYQPWESGKGFVEPSDEWKTLFKKIVNYLFSTTLQKSASSYWEVTGYLRKGIRLKFTHVQSAAVKGGDEARNPEIIQHLGKYRHLDASFEMGGVWYVPHREKDFNFTLEAQDFRKSYQAQPWDYGKHLNQT